MRSSSRSPKSRTQFVRISAPKGVNRFADQSRVPDGYLTDAQNVRLSKGAPEPRPGLRRRYDVTTALGDDLPVTGIGAWRFPADDDSPATHHLLLFGQKDGEGRLYSDSGIGIVDVTPMDGDKSLLTGAGLDAYFAELNYKTFMVNGRDGIVLYDGSNTAANAAQAVDALEQLHAPTLAKEFGTLRPDTDYDWQFDRAGGLLTDITFGPQDLLHPNNGGVREALAISSVAGSAGMWVYHKYASPLNLTAPRYLSDHLNTAVACDQGSFIPLRLHIGRIVTGDSTTDPNSPSWVPTTDNAISWDLPAGKTGTLNYLSLPLPSDAASQAILAAIDYVVLEAVNSPPVLNIGDLLGSDHTNLEVWKLGFHGLFSSGYLSTGNTRYRVVPFNTNTQSNGPASETVVIECYEGLSGLVDQSSPPSKDLCRRVKITVDFTNVGEDVDQVKVYRAQHEPGEASIPIEGLNWYYVAAADRADKDVNNLVVVYDNLPENELSLDPLLQLPFDESPTAFNDEAPWYIASTGTRILYARTKSNPGRVYASEVGKGSAVPNIDIDDYDLDETPHGGFDDVTHDTGGTITGLFTRMNDTLVFLDSDLIIWTRANEFTVDEKWQFTPISAPGCIASRSICRIVGGVVYAGADGIYFLPDNSYQVVPVPLSEAVRGYFDDVPNAARDKIACDYDPVNRLLLVALPEPGETKPSCLAVYDTSSREWQGKWKADDAGFQPGIVFTDYQPSTGQHVVYLPDAATGTVWTVRDPETDPTPYGDGDTAEDVECSVTTRYIELDGYKSKIVRRRLEFTYDEQTATDDPLTLSNVSLTIKSRPGGVKEFDYPDVDTDPSVEGNGLIEYGTSGDGLERLDGVQGLEHQAIVAWSNDGGNAKPIRFLGLSLSLVPAGRFH